MAPAPSELLLARSCCNSANRDCTLTPTVYLYPQRPDEQSSSGSLTADLSEVPLKAMASAIAAWSNSIEQSVSEIDRMSFATHALVANSSLDLCTGVRVDNGHRSAAVWVAVGLRTHHAMRHGNDEISRSVDVPAASAETTVLLVC